MRLNLLLFGVVLFVVSPVIVHAADPAGAASKSPGDDALSATARDLLRKADDAWHRGQWDQCRASLLAAWAIKPHRQIAGNLAACEVKLGMYRDAAEHLAFAMRAYPEGFPQELRLIFAEATAKVGTINIVAESGAAILVDDKPIGNAPLPGAIYLEPGKHTLEARPAQGSAIREEVETAAGTTHDVVLQKKEEAATQTKPATAPIDHLSQPSDRLQPAQRKVSVPLIIAGGATAGAALIAGVVFTAVANGKSTDADAMRAPGGNSACLAQPRPASCDAIKNSLEGVDTFTNIAAVAYVASGVAAVATVTYALWPRGKAASATTVRAAPWVGADGGGWVVGGHF